MKVICPRFVRFAAGLATILGLATAASSTSAAPLQLTVAEDAAGVEVLWTSTSLTPRPPYLHYEYQVQTSSNLVHWEDFGPLVPGGVWPAASRLERVRISRDRSAAFVRVRYRFSQPGANLAGLDLSGAGLSGGDLAGADLTGSTFDGALIEGTRLDGANVGGVSFRHARGTPLLSALGGPPTALLSKALPRLRYWPRAEDYPAVASDLLSPAIFVVTPTASATVSSFNAVLAQLAGSIVGSMPGVSNGPAGLVTLRLPGSVATAEQRAAQLRTSGLFVSVGRDVQAAPAALPKDDTSATGLDWAWTLPAAGGNWGLEIMGVPQLWNFNEALSKREGGSVVPVIVGVVEGGMVGGHEDLALRFGTNGPGTAPDSAVGHGAHVAGIIGALHGNDVGIHGVSPYVDLIAETPGTGLITEQWERDAVEQLAHLGARVINISIGIPWGASTNLPQSVPGLAANLDTNGVLTADLMRLIGGAGPLPFLCVAAGNESDSAKLGGADVPAVYGSGFANAALRALTGNILVVEAAGASDYGSVDPADLRRSAFSNINGHLSAPGENILSAYYPAFYRHLDGTSMATPNVAGLVAYLLALDPGLSSADIAFLLFDRPLPVAGGGSALVQAWRAAMAIDDVRGDRTVLRLLLDIDDGTTDGNLRVAVPAARPERDRAFQPVEKNLFGAGGDFASEDVDNDGGPGDGRVDMADFRRWRDWLLAGEVVPPFPQPVHALNGSPDHPKRDANRDGRVTADETGLFPRGDFNGDGFMDRDTAQVVPGALRTVGPLEDLEVLASSGLWQDPDYSAAGLRFLIDSVDLQISAENFFTRNPGVSSGHVSARDVGSRAPLFYGNPIAFSPLRPVHLLTVPVGQALYVASEPISLARIFHGPMRI